ncbi:kinesin-like calmodulin-binding protein zwichel [Stylonychia lemnae]|uniref:Kinesin-like calmodulin-binding protein zwichel n=1 Tax=Stylonychia lemnae TaxID=5949 RepID=A0A078AKM7_STYLE|nr:kinesin-like calmodulin-binding protein zwichel [Stylonychia lemnae]|eukprot:CDW82915.1 kinesin-like calmodulin-binding protein zwichel [Stylonychia lemnae]
MSSINNQQQKQKQGSNQSYKTNQDSSKYKHSKYYDTDEEEKETQSQRSHNYQKGKNNQNQDAKISRKSQNQYESHPVNDSFKHSGQNTDQHSSHRQDRNSYNNQNTDQSSSLRSINANQALQQQQQYQESNSNQRSKQTIQNQQNQINDPSYQQLSQRNQKPPENKEVDSSTSSSPIEYDPDNFDIEDFVNQFKFAPDPEEEEQPQAVNNNNEGQYVAQSARGNQEGQSNPITNRQMQTLSDQEDQEEEKQESSFESFHDRADDSDSDDLNDSELGGMSHRQHSKRSFIPIEFAKNHIQKIEEDMKRMHDRHVVLMREMDENYKLIEKETQDYYLEFLQKWKDVAKSKITQYRKAIDLLYNEKDQIQKEKDKAIENLNEKYLQLQREKEKILRDHINDIQLRDDEREMMKKNYEDEIRKLERERQDLRYKVNDRDQKILEIERDMLRMKDDFKEKEDILEIENSKLRNEFELRINEYENTLNKKIEENKSLLNNNQSLTQKIQSLDQQLQNISVLSSSNGTMSNASGPQNLINVQPQNQSLPRTFNVSQIKNFKLNKKPNEGAPGGGQVLNKNPGNSNNQSIQILKEKISLQRNQNSDNVKITQLNNAGNNSFINQPKIISNLNIQNYSTLPKKKEELKELLEIDPYQAQIEDLKKQIEEKTKEYDKKLEKPKKENKELGVEINIEREKFARETGNSKNDYKIPRDDPRLFNIGMKYRQNSDIINKLDAEKKQIISSLDQQLKEILSQQQQHTLNAPQKSARGSKSMSPRKQSAIKASEIKQQNQSQSKVQSDKSLSQEEEKIQVEGQKQTDQNNSDQKLQEFMKQSISLLQLVDQIMSKFDDYIKANVMSEVNELRQRLLSQSLIDSNVVKEQYKKQSSEYQKAIDNQKQLGLSFKKMTQIIKEFRDEIERFKKRPSGVDQSAINNSRISDSNISMLEEEERKTYEKQFKTLEEKAKLGIKTREEKIIQLKNQIQKQTNDGQEKIKQYQDKMQILEKRINVLQDENQNGEAMLLRQIEELQKNYEMIKCKHQNEMYQRKMLHNQIEDMKGKIRVFCRVRPLNQQEKDMQCLEVVKVLDGQRVQLPIKNDGIKGGSIEREFDFDSCFDKFSSQDQVFEDVKMLLQSAMDGFNVCIFAYGQTGSGKTFTMQGSEENPGIIPRALTQLFNIKRQMEMNNFTIHFECYMVELYINNLIDCLFDRQSTRDRPPSLDIREDQGRTYIENVTQVPIEGIDDLKNCYNKGLKTRKVSSTKMNDMSSRSHMIFTIVINTFNEQTKQKTMSKISFVDLAGSERQTKAQGINERITEANSINKSLFSLGLVVRQLTQNEKHISYNDSKLTQLMKDSLGGNSKTLMFVNISPSEYNLQETRQSVIFGQKAKSIVNNVQKNVESQEMQKLKEENDQLKRLLQNTTTLKTTSATQKSMIKQS